jgi:NitT/TauT family transport system substrate-binding protein
MIKIGKISRLFWSLTIIFLLVACSGTASTTTNVPLKIGWTLWQGDYTLLVANQMGFFKNHNLNIKPVRYDSSTQAIPDLAGAKIDGGLLTMSDFLLASNSADIKAVMASDAGSQYTIVASPDIKSVNALRGKRIGLNMHTSSEIFVSDMLKTKVMTMSNVTPVEMSPDQVSKNIPGQIDAGLVWEPYTTQAIKQGLVVVYQNADDSMRFPKLLVFRTTLVNQRPQDIRAFILAWDEAVLYRLSHPQESLAIISKATGLSASDLNSTGDITLYRINDNVKLFANVAGTGPSSIFFIAGFNLDFLITAGYLNYQPHLTTLLDPSFLK